MLRFHHRVFRYKSLKKTKTKTKKTKNKKNKNNKLLTTIYRKPTRGKNFIDPTSKCQKSMINSIPFSQKHRRYRSLIII